MRYLQIFLLSVSFFITGAASAGDIVVKAEQAKPIKGGVIFFLYDEATYIDKPLQELYAELDETGAASITFANVAPGQYALVVVHDKNGNRKMDKNFLGIPKEKGGFSNNAPAKMGPAKFKNAVFEVNDAPVTQIIFLNKKS